MATPFFVSACLLLAALDGISAEGTAELEVPADATVLLQHTATQTHRGRAPLSTQQVLGRSRAATAGSPWEWLQTQQTDLYCSAFGGFCQPPFDCDKMDFAKESERSDTEGWAADGKPNYKSWCTTPQYLPMITRCAAGNLVEAGRVQFGLTSIGTMGPFTMELDGSYCFLEGHCVNDAVTNATTAEEACKMCDERFGHEAWTHWGSESSPPEHVIGFGMEEVQDPRDGFTSRKQTTPYLLAACAMGNYHCDVVYCKETYCKNEYYINKYSHLLKDNGWTK